MIAFGFHIPKEAWASWYKEKTLWQSCNIYVAYQYLWIVVPAPFESFVYKANFQVSLEPGGGSWWSPCLFHWRLLSAEEKQTDNLLTNKWKWEILQCGRVYKNSCTLRIQMYLSWLDSLCFLFLSSFPPPRSEEWCFTSSPLLRLSFSSRLCCSFCRSFSFSLSLWALLRRPG